MVKLINDTVNDITVINIRPNWICEWSDNILAENVVLEEDKEVVLCVELDVYDLHFTFDDWTVGVIHQMDVNDITEAEIQRRWNGLPYLVYTSVSTGEEVDTSDFENLRLKRSSLRAHGRTATSLSPDSVTVLLDDDCF